MLWNTAHFAGLAISFAGSLLLALFSSDFEIENGRVFVRTKYAWAALWVFTIGFLLILFWGTRLLQTG